MTTNSTPIVTKLKEWDSLIIQDNYSDPKPGIETTESLKNQATGISQLPLESKIKQAAKLILNSAFIAKPENEQHEILDNCQLSRKELSYILDKHPKIFGADKNRNYQWFDMRKLISDHLALLPTRNAFASWSHSSAYEQLQDVAVNFTKKALTMGILGKGGIYELYTKYQESQPLPPDTVKDWN